MLQGSMGMGRSVVNSSFAGMSEEKGKRRV